MHVSQASYSRVYQFGFGVPDGHKICMKIEALDNIYNILVCFFCLKTLRSLNNNFQQHNKHELGLYLRKNISFFYRV